MKSDRMLTLSDVFQRWENFLASLDDAQIIAPWPESDLTVKDVIAHLRAWQQVSIARLEAALLGQEPAYPGWTAGREPDAEEELETYNRRIYEAGRDQVWADVHGAWRDGFVRFMELATAILEADLLATGRYAWLPDYPLSAVVVGSCEHHEEHLNSLRTSMGPGGP